MYHLVYLITLTTIDKPKNKKIYARNFKVKGIKFISIKIT